MHPSSMENMKCFFTEFVRPGNSVLDIGSLQVKKKQPTYKELLPEGSSYVGADLQKGLNVDLVLSSPYSWPELLTDSFDVVISGQTFEHSEYFWLLFKEIVRVTKQKGFICIVAPSKGKVHRYPVDCWRLLPDGMRALAKLEGIELLKTYKDRKTHWEDCIGIFQK